MVQYTLRITEDEKRLLDAIAAVQYGEIYAPKFREQAYTEIAHLSESEHSLLDIVRAGTPISFITIHQGAPTFAEVDEIIAGFRCRKKIKFPAG